jgi:hypothetical protein
MEAVSVVLPFDRFPAAHFPHNIHSAGYNSAVAEEYWQVVGCWELAVGYGFAGDD